MHTIKATLLASLFAVSFNVVAEVSVTNPWVRGTVAKQTSTGAFMTLKSDQATQLISASSPVAGLVEIHEMAMDGQTMKMRAIPAINLPANTAVELKPGSYHIMLMQLKQPLEASSKVPVTLNFVNAAKQKESVEIQAEVRAMNHQPEHAHKHGERHEGKHHHMHSGSKH